MPIIIKGEDYEISPVNGSSALFDVALYSKSAKAKEPTKKMAYGCPFDSVLRRISRHRLDQKREDPFTDVREYMQSLIEEERALIEEIKDKLPQEGAEA